jgi:hypothetical protein
MTDQLFTGSYPSDALTEAKQLRARVAELEAVALDYRYVLHSAKAGRDLYCGMYVAKEYRFTRDQIDAALAKISAALQKQDTATAPRTATQSAKSPR